VPASRGAERLRVERRTSVTWLDGRSKFRVKTRLNLPNLQNSHPRPSLGEAGSAAAWTRADAGPSPPAR